MPEERRMRVTANDMDHVDQVFQELLERREQGDRIRREWEFAHGIPNAEAGGAQNNPYQVDPQMFWIMAAVAGMNNWDNQFNYEDTYREIVSDFSQTAPQGDSLEMPGSEFWVHNVMRFLRDTQIDSLTADSEDDIRKFFLISQIGRYADTLRERYPDVYYAVTGDPEEEDHYRLQLQQACALGRRMQAVMDAYYEYIRDHEAFDTIDSPYTGDRAIADIYQNGREDVLEAQYLAPMSEDINAQLAHKYREQDREPEAPGVTLRVPGAMKILADFPDDDLTRLTDTQLFLGRRMAENLFDALTPEVLRNGGVVRGGKDGRNMEKEDLIFVNGQSLREYCLERLPENLRTDEGVSRYSGALLARAMQQGNSRIALAQVNSMQDYRYGVTMHPVKLDLTECQPAIEDDESYGWIHRRFFNWGPFKCRTRQEKAEEAYQDPELQSREEGLKDRLDEEIRVGRQDRVFLSVYAQTRAIQETAADCVSNVQEKDPLAKVYMDGDTRDLQDMAMMLMLNKLNLPEKERNDRFNAELQDMVETFHAPDSLGRREMYLDRMGDFIDQFDPDGVNLSNPNDMFRLQTYLRLSQLMQTKAHQYPEWYYGRYPEADQREKYELQGQYTQVVGAYWQTRGVELNGTFTNLSSLILPNEETVDSVKAFAHEISEGNMWVRPASLKVPAFASRYMNKLPGELDQMAAFDDTTQYLMGLLTCAESTEASRAIVGARLEDVFYVDGKSLKEYVRENTQAAETERLNYESYLMNALVSGDHRVEMIRLVADTSWEIGNEACDDWVFRAVRIEPDLSRCEAVRQEDGKTNVERAAELSASDRIDSTALRERADTIQAEIQERLEDAAEAYNRQQRNAALPLARVRGLAQNLQVQKWEDLENEWKNRRADRIEERLQARNEAARAQNRTRHAMNFEELVEEAEEAGEIKKTEDIVRPNAATAQPLEKAPKKAEKPPVK